MRAIYYKSSTNHLLAILSTIYIFIFYAIADLRQYSSAFLLCYGFTMLLFLLSLLNRKVEYKRILVWIVAFCGFNLLSVLWAVDSGTTTSRQLELIMKFLAIYGIAGMIKDKSDFILVVRLFLIVQMLAIFYTIPTGILNAVMHGRQNISADNTSLWNGNTLGLMAGYSLVLISMFLGKKQKGSPKVLSCLAIVFLIYIAIASGSRKAFLFPVLYFALLYTFSGRRGRIRKLVFGLITIVAAYMIVINIPSLYRLIGFRLEAILDLFIGGGTEDLSVLTRQSMMEYAIELVCNRPLFGHGFYGFSFLYGNRMGLFTYAHNNYLEIMVGTGIVGVALYYSIHINILRLSIRLSRIKIQEKEIFKQNQIIALILAQLAIDFALVSCFQFQSIMLIALCYVATQRQAR